jgi:NAD-dependent deacetylase
MTVHDLSLEMIERTLEIESARKAVSKARSIVILTGAGISAESGVPTFREGGNATVWRGMPFEQLSSAAMVQKDLPLVWEWFDYRRGVVAGCEPNAAHYAIASAQKSGRFDTLTLVTQNIDSLHRTAGSAGFIELHGNINQARCLSCNFLRDLGQIPEDERPPVCPECFDSMRPNVVLFGEPLDDTAMLRAYEKSAACEVCVIIGTSAVVYPANQIPMIAKRGGATVIEINPEETELTASVDVSLRGKAAEVLPILLA